MLYKQNFSQLQLFIDEIDEEENLSWNLCRLLSHVFTVKLLHAFFVLQEVDDWEIFKIIRGKSSSVPMYLVLAFLN